MIITISMTTEVFISIIMYLHEHYHVEFTKLIKNHRYKTFWKVLQAMIF